MPEVRLRGVAASPGAAAGPALVLADPTSGSDRTVPEAQRDVEVDKAKRALDAAATQLEQVASGLRASGRAEEAEIVATGAVMAADPALLSAVEGAVRYGGRPAPAALLDAAEEFAAAIESVDDEMLAARADDVRSVGRRAARVASGSGVTSGTEPGEAFVLVAADLGPADVAELCDGAAAIALAAGGVRAHAAIVARSLGIPMVVGVGEPLLAAEAGGPLVVDGDAGTVVLEPEPQLVERVDAARRLRLRARERLLAEKDLPATTTDGRRVRVLANVASTAEVRAALAEGAEGVGLLRTELAFLDAPRWPGTADHAAFLEPVLAALGARVATVRVLDFGGDKTPAFIAGARERGIGLLLREPRALEAQLRAIVASRADTELRTMLPMVESAADVRAVRRLLDALEQDGEVPALGAMVETAGAADAAADIARASDFLSIGTNDLTHSVMDADRFSPGDAVTHHPLVLRAIARTVAAARDAEIPIEVCGEAASDPVLVPLLVGLGVDELSVGAARVAAVRAWVRALDYADCRVLAEQALGVDNAVEVAALGRRLSRSLDLLESGDAADERVDGGSGIVALGPQP
jgi:phosphoenolpyruvate-protein kinase (PTS system EI component)